MCFGLYIHIPFCRRKCPYCSFVSITGAEDMMEPYVNALVREYGLRSESIFSGTPQTLYIGGGTPSLLPARHVRRILQSIDTTATKEITIEVNPDSCSFDWLQEIRDAGVSRISLGIQSLEDDLLANLGRLHTASQAIEAYEHIRHVGFESVSVDLMFGVPGQTAVQWDKTLQTVIALGPDHVSAYSLGIEEDTDYFRKIEQGGLQIPEHSETADMYRILIDRLGQSGYQWYELSNFARQGKESIHNSSYWNFTPYLGIGVSAHSFDGCARRWNICDVEKYIKLIEVDKDVSGGSETHEGYTRQVEMIMLSLRTRAGLVPGSLDLAEEQLHSLLSVIDNMNSAGFLERNPAGAFVLTTEGAVIADEILSELLTELDEK